MFLVLAYDDLSPGVLHNVLAGLRPVRGVDPCCLATTRDGAHVGQDPLGRIESDDRDGVERLNAEVHERLARLKRLLIILRPRRLLPRWGPATVHTRLPLKLICPGR